MTSLPGRQRVQYFLRPQGDGIQCKVSVFVGYQGSLQSASFSGWSCFCYLFQLRSDVAQKRASGFLLLFDTKKDLASQALFWYDKEDLLLCDVVLTNFSLSEYFTFIICRKQPEKEMLNFYSYKTILTFLVSIKNTFKQFYSIISIWCHKPHNFLHTNH